jgi:DNA polymerase-3 subunit alpha
MDNIPLFGDRKNGRQAIEYPHSLLEEVLKETYGIFVYQEQVMQAAQVLAGYSLGEADLLRRAMGKKIKAEMDAQRARFVEGCAANDIKPQKANELFDLIDKFAGYGFNKSHAAAYALVAYHTAWLKAHHPAEFFAASMSYDLHQTDKLCLFVDDLRRMGLTLLPPDINRSEAAFDVEDGQVRYALGALKGVGEKAMEELAAERTKAPFASLEDFAARIDPRILNRRQLESLAAAGALDGLNPNRAAVHAGAETILAHAASAHQEKASGQGGLFGGSGSGPAEVAPIRLPRGAQWTQAERMAAERDAFGFYFSAHPVDQHRHLLAAHRVRQSNDLGSVPIPAEGRGAAVMAGLVEEARWRTSQKGRRFLMARLSDGGGQFDATVFDDDAAAAVEAAAKGSLCGLLSVELDRRPGEDQPRVTIKRFQPLEEVARRSRVELTVHCQDEPAVEAVLGEIKALPTGSGLIRLLVPVSGERKALLLLPGRFAVDAELAARLTRFVGEESVTLVAAEQLRLVG